MAVAHLWVGESLGKVAGHLCREPESLQAWKQPAEGALVVIRDSLFHKLLYIYLYSHYSNMYLKYNRIK